MVRFGIVGFGLHAVKRLMPAFHLTPNARVTALSRRDLERARASAQQYGIAAAFDDPAGLCRSPDVDAVFVATPNVCHRENVLTALQHGKAVLCEKPMGMNASECGEMVEAARRSGRPLGVAHVFRFCESVRWLRECVQSGEIGRPVFARAEFSYQGRGHARTWINSKAVGGGPLADVGVHCIDALHHILQDEVTGVYAAGYRDGDCGDVEAAAAVTLQFSRGALGTVLVSTRADYRTPLEIVGEEGVARAGDAFSLEQAVTLELLRGGAVVRTREVFNQDAFPRLIEAFAGAVEGRGQFPVPGEQGWRNQAVLDAAYSSMESGQSAMVSEGASSAWR